MSTRIEELIEQADDIEILPDELNFSTDYLCDIDPRRVKKFAKLLIKETLQVARAGIEYGDGMEDAVSKYFEVEL